MCPNWDITPEMITQTARDVGEHTVISRTGGAPTLAVGMAQILSDVLGGQVPFMLVDTASGMPVCGVLDTGRTDEAVTLLVPADIDRVRAADRHVARTWRECTRTAFEAYLARGYTVTTLVRLDEQVSGYVLERDFTIG